LRRAKIFFGCFSGCLAYFSYSEQEPILALRLQELDLGSNEMGLFFSILPICYLISGLAVQFIPRSIDSRIILVYACLIDCVSLLLIGPSKVLEFPEKVYLIGIGQFLCGNAIAVLNVLSLPEMIRQANLVFPGQEDSVSNYCSGIFNSCLGIGQILGPLFGSNVTVALGFRYTQDIVALINFCYGILYFSLAAGYEGCKKLPDLDIDIDNHTTYEDIANLIVEPKSRSEHKERSKLSTEKKKSMNHSFSGTPISIPKFNLS
jgi:MFS family permease